MHPCLQIEELFTLIAEHTLRDPANGKSSTLSLARTCHGFLEPALDVLWRDQGNLFPLFRCFPEDLVEFGKSPAPWWTRQYTEFISFKRPLQPSDWPRFDYYAKRIKYLGFSDSRDPVRYVKNDALRAIESYRPSSFLPNLRRLLWHDDMEDSLLHAGFLLGRDAVQVGVLIKRSREASLLSFLLSLKVTSPFLQIFDLYFHFSPSYDVFSAFSDLTCGLKYLHRLAVPKIGVTPSALLHLSSLSSLTELHLSLDFDIDPTCLNDRAFLALQHLSIHLSNLDYLSGFLAAVRSCSLKAIDIHLSTSPPTAAALWIFFTVIGQHPSTAALHGVRIACPQKPPDPYADDYIVRATMFQPLLTLRNLSCFIVDIEYTYDLDDALLDDMALAWPRLTELHLVSATRWQNSRVTLDGLLPFARHCPELRSLGLTVNATVPLRSSKQLNTVMGIAPLPAINLGFSVIAPPLEPVASFLCCAFPKLSTIRIAWRSHDIQAEHVVYHQRWKDVERLLPAHRHGLLIV